MSWQRRQLTLRAARLYVPAEHAMHHVLRSDADPARAGLSGAQRGFQPLLARRPILRLGSHGARPVRPRGRRLGSTRTCTPSRKASTSSKASRSSSSTDTPVRSRRRLRRRAARRPAAWLGTGTASGRAGSTCWRPQPRAADEPADTFFLGPPDRGEIEGPGHPRSALAPFLPPARQRDEVDKLKVGAAVNAPTVSASMATALLAYSGIAVKMLVDQRLDAQLHTMFMVEYQPGGVAHPHDHPLEEA